MSLRILVFLLIIASILFGAHFYIWARLVRDTGLASPYRASATWALITLAAVSLAAFPLARTLPRSVASPLMWIVYSWIGVAFFLIVLLAASDFARVVVDVARRVASAPADAERRRFIARLFGGTVAVGAFGLGAIGMGGARAASVIVKKVKVSLAKLSPATSGYRIVQVSDLHIGPTIGKEFLLDIVDRVNALRPDLVAITGDLVDGSVAELGDIVRHLRGLEAKDGVYFITGNHEYYSGADEWVRFLPTLGIRVLSNERVRIGGLEGFDLAGINDFAAGSFGPQHGPDLERALAGRNIESPVILLAHQPRAFHEAERLGVDLQLSGHTHGGQLFPFNFVVKLVEPFIAGLYERGRSQLYVSRGTGYWGPPMRLGAPAEITEIELRHGVTAHA